MNRVRLGFVFLSAIPGLATLWFLAQLPAAFRGEAYVQQVEWLPQLGFTFDVRIPHIQQRSSCHLRHRNCFRKGKLFIMIECIIQQHDHG